MSVPSLGEQHQPQLLALPPKRSLGRPILARPWDRSGACGVMFSGASPPVDTREALLLISGFEPVHAFRDVMTPVPRVLLSVSLAGLAPKVSHLRSNQSTSRRT